MSGRAAHLSPTSLCIVAFRCSCPVRPLCTHSPCCRKEPPAGASQPPSSQSTLPPLHPQLCLCEDASVLGTPFYVMEHVRGRIFTEPSLPGMAPAQRTAVYQASRPACLFACLFSVWLALLLACA